MKPEVFNVLLDARVEKIWQVLESKGVDYATAGDSLHNFKRAAGMTGETPLQVCVGFMVKHLVSVLDLVDRQSNRVAIPVELVDEKVGDAINYLILLEALFQEARGQ